MGLDQEIILSDIEENNWYLTIRLNPKVNKVDIIKSVIKALRNEEFRLMGNLPRYKLNKQKFELHDLLIQNDISAQ